MHVDVLTVASLLTAAPFVAIVAMLVLYTLRRVPWVGRVFGVQPSAVGLGMAFLFLQAFWRPSQVHAIELREEVDVDEDDEGEPDTPGKQLTRQLRRIRMGELVERIVLRL